MSADTQELIGKYILLSERISEEQDGRFSAFCEELGIATCAASQGAASRRLSKAATAILNTATEDGEILEFLRERGIRLYPRDELADTSLVSEQLKRLGWGRLEGHFGMGRIDHRPYSPSLLASVS